MSVRGSCAVVVAIVLLLAPAQSSGAVIPGTGAPREGQLAGGPFVTWLKAGATARQCPDTSVYRVQPGPARVLDLRTMRVRSLPAMPDGGVLEVIAIDRSGVALARVARCVGDDSWGRLDLATGAFVDYSTMAEAQPLPVLQAACPTCNQTGIPATYGFEFGQFVHGEAIEVKPNAYDSEALNVLTWRVTRVDMTSGRTRTAILKPAVVDRFDTFARARNGDLVWASARTDTPGLSGPTPCVVRRWSHATGAITSTRPTAKGYLPGLAVARGISACGHVLDPDTGRVYRESQRHHDDYWQVSCGTFEGSRLRLCGLRSDPGNLDTAASRCCVGVYDRRDNTVQFAPPLAVGGPWQQAVTKTDTHVVWQTMTKFRSGEQTGPLYAMRLDDLRQASEITRVRRRGANVTISWRTFGTKYRTQLARYDGIYAWGDPRSWYLSGIRPAGSSRCSGPYTFHPVNKGYTIPGRCRPPMPHRAGSITFVDPPGRQTYFLDGGGFDSRRIVL